MAVALFCAWTDKDQEVYKVLQGHLWQVTFIELLQNP